MTPENLEVEDWRTSLMVIAVGTKHGHFREVTMAPLITSHYLDMYSFVHSHGHLFISAKGLASSHGKCNTVPDCESSLNTGRNR